MEKTEILERLQCGGVIKSSIATRGLTYELYGWNGADFGKVGKAQFDKLSPELIFNDAAGGYMLRTVVAFQRDREAKSER